MKKKPRFLTMKPARPGKPDATPAGPVAAQPPVPRAEVLAPLGKLPNRLTVRTFPPMMAQIDHLITPLAARGVTYRGRAVNLQGLLNAAIVHLYEIRMRSVDELQAVVEPSLRSLERLEDEYAAAPAPLPNFAVGAKALPPPGRPVTKKKRG
jgi:hypothetical protein